MRSMAHFRTRHTTRRPSRRSDPCRTEPLPITHVGQSVLVGGVRRIRHQACELCTSDSRVPNSVPTRGRNRAPSTIYKRQPRFPPRLRGAYGTYRNQARLRDADQGTLPRGIKRTSDLPTGTKRASETQIKVPYLQGASARQRHRSRYPTYRN